MSRLDAILSSAPAALDSQMNDETTTPSSRVLLGLTSSIARHSNSVHPNNFQMQALLNRALLLKGIVLQRKVSCLYARIGDVQLCVGMN